MSPYFNRFKTLGNMSVVFYSEMEKDVGHTLQTAACALRGSPSAWSVRSSGSADTAAGLAAPASGFASPLGACLRGRSILKVMAVEVQYSSNPYKYLAEERRQEKSVQHSCLQWCERLKLHPYGRSANCKLDEKEQKLRLLDKRQLEAASGNSLAVSTFDIVASG